ncbi:MAG TPA: TonB family protein [Myxococcota bacterium]|nr:TonB family protein [Myxococcota bacterium]
MFALLTLALAQDPGAPAPDAPPPAAEEVAPLLKEPVLLEFVQAPYPPEAEAQGLSAVVRLLIEVDEAGAVSKVEVVSPAGHGFDEAAVEAAKKFRFSPAEDASGPVPVALEFDYRFELAPVPVPEEVALAPIVLEGQLRENATRKPIPDAVVQVLQNGQPLFNVSTDAEGRYAFRGLSPGKYVLRAYGVDHPKDDDVEFEIVPGEVTSITVWLTRGTYREAGVIGIYEKEKTPEVTRRVITMEEVRRIPGTFGDPVRVIQNLPGVARPPFGGGLLVLRGANPEDSNVYVDGVEVPLVYHLGGYRSVINASLIESVDYLPGTYSARYGRSTGGVIDVRTHTQYPEQSKIVWRSDFLDTGVFATGQIGKKVGYSAGIRRSYLDALLGLVLKDTGFYAAPRWFDYQLKLEAIDAGPDKISGFLFGFQDDLIVRLDASDEPLVGLHYSTHRLVFHWEHPIDDKLSVELQPAVGLDGVRFGFGSLVELSLKAWLVELRGNLSYKPSPHLTIRTGLDSEISSNDLAIYASSVPVDNDNPLAEDEPLEVTEGLWQFQPDPFAEVIWRPLQDLDRLSLVGGLRLSTAARTEAPPKLGLDPRFGMRFELFKGGTLKAGTGLYHQAPQGSKLGGDLFLEQAWSSELGWEQRFTPAISADLTGFYRKMDGLGGGDDPGIGRAYGMEVMLRHAPANNFFGWISYTLSRSERNDSPGDPEAWYPFDYDQTHILTLVAGYTLPWDFDLSTRFQYVTGNPYTPYEGGLFLMDSGGYIPLAGIDTNSDRMAPYYALDLRIEKLFTFKHWQLSIFSDLLNAVHGKNPEFTIYNYDYTEKDYVQGLPFFPSFGFQAEVKL